MGCMASLVAAAGAVGREPRWISLPDLPEGVAGQYVGTQGSRLIVAGGSHFRTPSWSGGRREWVQKAFVLSQPDGTWREHGLPHSVAHGASVSHRRGVLLIGGSNPEGHSRRCAWLGSNGQSISVVEAPDLPLPLAYCGAARVQETAYVFGGQISPTATRAESALYSLDLQHGGAEWKAERAFPGAGRIYAAVASAGGKLYVAGGASLSAGPDGKPQRTYLRDAWCYEPRQGWRALPELPRLSCAAPSLGVGDRFAVFGGSDGSLDARVGDLRERHPGFPRAIQVYSPSRNAWNTAGEAPFSLVATTATEWRGLAVIPGGEDRPSHRSRAVWATAMKEFPDARE